MATTPSHGTAGLPMPQQSLAATNGHAATHGDAPPLAAATAAVLVKSEKVPDDAPIVMGHDFNADVAAGRVDYDALLQSYATVGFQATHFGQAVDRVNDMVRCHGRLERKEGAAVHSGETCMA